MRKLVYLLMYIGYIFRGSNYVIFILLLSLLMGCQLWKERICASMSRFFLFRVDCLSGRVRFPGKQ